jgi:PAS domain S-box-containing protein
MSTQEQEDELLRSVALQNASAIFVARQRVQHDLIMAKEALESKSEALAHSLSMLHATLESTTDGILVTDLQQKVTSFNERYIAIWQIPREVMESREHRDVLAHISPQLKDPQRFLSRIEEIYATSPAETTDVLELADGRVFERHSRTQIYNGLNIGRVWNVRDMTERTRAEESSARLAAVVESSDDAIVSKSLEGIISTWNKGAERIFGYTAAEVVGKSIYILIPEERRSEEPQIIERLKRGERVETYETVRVRKDGARVHVSLTVSPVKDASGGIIGASKIARDITERKRAEEERARLTDILAKLLQSERAARAESDRLGAIKDEFLATLSHELRTPLSAILGWTQLLRRRVTHESDLRQGLDTIERNVRIQTQLIEDLLDISRISSGKLRLDIRRVEPVSFVDAALETVRPAADAKGIAIEKQLDPAAGPIFGDPDRLQQVVWNLLLNAIKFTPKGGKVQVLVESKESQIEIRVIDTGIGIDAEFLPHVFERFRQADASSTRSHGGLGLGLSIARHVVELHGGTITALSAGTGRGATFIVQLPIGGASEGITA